MPKVKPGTGQVRKANMMRRKRLDNKAMQKRGTGSFDFFFDFFMKLWRPQVRDQKWQERLAFSRTRKSFRGAPTGRYTQKLPVYYYR